MMRKPMCWLYTSTMLASCNQDSEWSFRSGIEGQDSEICRS